MTEFILNESELESLGELSKVYRNLGAMFTSGEGDAELLRVAANLVRQGGDVLDEIAERLEAESV